MNVREFIDKWFTIEKAIKQHDSKSIRHSVKEISRLLNRVAREDVVELSDYCFLMCDLLLADNTLSHQTRMTRTSIAKDLYKKLNKTLEDINPSAFNVPKVTLQKAQFHLLKIPVEYAKLVLINPYATSISCREAEKDIYKFEGILLNSYSDSSVRENLNIAEVEISLANIKKALEEKSRSLQRVRNNTPAPTEREPSSNLTSHSNVSANSVSTSRNRPSPLPKSTTIRPNTASVSAPSTSPTSMFATTRKRPRPLSVQSVAKKTKRETMAISMKKVVTPPPKKLPQLSDYIPVIHHDKPVDIAPIKELRMPLFSEATAVPLKEVISPQLTAQVAFQDPEPLPMPDYKARRIPWLFFIENAEDKPSRAQQMKACKFALTSSLHIVSNNEVFSILLNKLDNYLTMKLKKPIPIQTNNYKDINFAQFIGEIEHLCTQIPVTTNDDIEHLVSFVSTTIIMDKFLSEHCQKRGELIWELYSNNKLTPLNPSNHSYSF